MKPKIKIRLIKSLPDIFKQVSYPEVAKGIGMKADTLKRYVNEKPEWFSLEQLYNMAEFLGVDSWWLLSLAHGWVSERAD